MASNTARLVLRKPDPSDLVDVVSDLGANFDKIDKLSRGELDFVQSTGGVAAFTVGTVMIPCNMITTVAGQRLIVQFDFLIQSTVANDIAQIWIGEGGTNHKQFFVDLTRANVSYAAQGWVRLAPAVGNHAYFIGASRSSGTGNLSVPGGATNPIQAVVLDLGQP